MYGGQTEEQLLANIAADEALYNDLEQWYNE